MPNNQLDPTRITMRYPLKMACLMSNIKREERHLLTHRDD